MANLLICNILYGRVATYYNKLKKTISKLHRSSSSVAFIKKMLHKRYICENQRTVFKCKH